MVAIQPPPKPYPTEPTCLLPTFRVETTVAKIWLVHSIWPPPTVINSTASFLSTQDLYRGRWEHSPS